MGHTKRRIPSHLSIESKRIWTQISKQFELFESDYTILRVALESLDRLEQARLIIERDGLILTDKAGKKYQNPALMIEKESRTGVLRAWKMLSLDAEPPLPVGRPPGHGR